VRNASVPERREANRLAFKELLCAWDLWQLSRSTSIEPSRFALQIGGRLVATIPTCDTLDIQPTHCVHGFPGDVTSAEVVDAILG
jgi:hypothetical protein